jgi:RHS repeat-associated protein
VYLKGHLLAEAGGNFSHTDGLGSPVARTNAAKSVVSRTRYEPYGLTATGTVPTTIGFTGHVNDADTGLVYMQQRYYDPIAARFMSTDPVLAYANNVQGLNRYSYANNNPYKYVDPDGRETEKSEPDKRQQQLDEQRRRARANCTINCEFISTTRENSSYDPNDVRGGFDSRGYSTVYAPGSYNPDEAGLLLLTMASMVIAPETALFKFFPEIGIVFKTEHYAARLEKAGLDARMVEGLVKRDVSSFARFLGPGAGFGGSLTVNGSLLRFTGKLLPSDIISIGTIYKVIPK